MFSSPPSVREWKFRQEQVWGGGEGDLLHGACRSLTLCLYMPLLTIVPGAQCRAKELAQPDGAGLPAAPGIVAHHWPALALCCAMQVPAMQPDPHSAGLVLCCTMWVPALQPGNAHCSWDGTGRAGSVAQCGSQEHMLIQNHILLGQARLAPCCAMWVPAL